MTNKRRGRKKKKKEKKEERGRKLEIRVDDCGEGSLGGGGGGGGGGGVEGKTERGSWWGIMLFSEHF